MKKEAEILLRSTGGSEKIFKKSEVMMSVESYMKKKMSAILIEKRKLYTQELEKATKTAKTALREPSIRHKDHQADSSLFPDINLSGRIHTLDKLIKKAEEALKKLKNGTYGFCKCGKAIPLARLEAVPFTEYCLDCKTETEKEDTIIISGVRQRISRINHVITL